MGGLGFDLGSSKAKLSRAREHLDELQRKLRVALDKQSPYAFRYELDPQTGWCGIFLTPTSFSEPRLGCIFGDVVHNLRCALDYIVTECVSAENRAVTAKNEFPIFLDTARYKASVYDLKLGPPALKKNGPLEGVGNPAAELFEELQPYHTQPDPSMTALWTIHQLSNSDKHRDLSLIITRLDAGSVKLQHDGRIIGSELLPAAPDWSPEQEYEIKRVRFDPLPTYISFAPPEGAKVGGKAKVPINPAFGARHTPGVAIQQAVDSHGLLDCCETVAAIIKRFEAR